MTRSPRRLREQVRETVGEQVRDLPLHAVRLAMFGVGRALLLSDRVTRDYKEITEGAGVKPVLGRLRHDVQHTAVSVVGTVVERVRGADEEPEPAPRTARTRTTPRPAARPAARTAERPAERPAPRDKEISVGKPAAAPRPAPEPADAKPATPAADRTEATPKPEPKAAAPKPKAEATPEPKAETKPAPKAEAKPAAKPAAEAEGAKAEELPVPDYDSATLPQLRARLRGLTADQVRLLREYERAHKARPEIVRMYENRISKLNGSH
ncbi:hypothetical protein [Actinomadura oligospora]|uniref:hypothetical protein n=1 Tax=Actinomadura oligospora TaxID=111804 RepID=UPI0004B6E93E|nr:hypothetical protein [Actinomadura oligospora]